MDETDQIEFIQIKSVDMKKYGRCGEQCDFQISKLALGQKVGFTDFRTRTNLFDNLFDFFFFIYHSRNKNVPLR